MLGRNGKTYFKVFELIFRNFILVMLDTFIYTAMNTAAKDFPLINDAWCINDDDDDDE